MLTVVRSLTLAAALTFPIAAAAHHGWAWTEERESRLTGTIRSISFGNPHMHVQLVNPQGTWEVDLSPPIVAQGSGFGPGRAKAGDRVSSPATAPATRTSMLSRARRSPSAARLTTSTRSARRRFGRIEQCRRDGRRCVAPVSDSKRGVAPDRQLTSACWQVAVEDVRSGFPLAADLPPDDHVLAGVGLRSAVGRNC